jgi:hypothetical protein
MPVPLAAPMPPPGVPMSFDGMPATPGMPMAAVPFPWYGPSPPGPLLPQMGPVQMELPRRESYGPPPAHAPAGYPTHPFVRGPRDFFMWGDVMAEEKARGSRPALVP